MWPAAVSTAAVRVLDKTHSITHNPKNGWFSLETHTLVHIPVFCTMRPVFSVHFTGQYVPGDEKRYVHVNDMRERGKYVHIPFPYMGGYGPYDGINGLPYEYDPHGDYRYAYISGTHKSLGLTLVRD